MLHTENNDLPSKNSICIDDKLFIICMLPITGHITYPSRITKKGISFYLKHEEEARRDLQHCLDVSLARSPGSLGTFPTFCVTIVKSVANFLPLQNKDPFSPVSNNISSLFFTLFQHPLQRWSGFAESQFKAPSVFPNTLLRCLQILLTISSQKPLLYFKTFVVIVHHSKHENFHWLCITV